MELVNFERLVDKDNKSIRLIKKVLIVSVNKNTPQKFLAFGV